jgi:hypothetical protein
VCEQQLCQPGGGTGGGPPPAGRYEAQVTWGSHMYDGQGWWSLPVAFTIT